MAARHATATPSTIRARAPTTRSISSDVL
jgi:hypothetical protein